MMLTQNMHSSKAYRMQMRGYVVGGMVGRFGGACDADFCVGRYWRTTFPKIYGLCVLANVRCQPHDVHSTMQTSQTIYIFVTSSSARKHACTSAHSVRTNRKTETLYDEHPTHDAGAHARAHTHTRSHCGIGTRRVRLYEL